MIPMEKLNALTDKQLLDLNKAVVDVLRQRQAERNRSIASSFARGDTVGFHDPRTNRLVVMKVTKINTKTISGVEVGDGALSVAARNWRVPPSMLKRVGA